MKIGIICPSEIALRRFMPALQQCKELEFAGLGVFTKEERFGDKDTGDETFEVIHQKEIDKAKIFIDQYGGKIFAIGQISGKPEVNDDKQDSYFKSRVSCDIDSLFLLAEPIDLSEFNDFIKISMQGSVTPVFGRSYEKLKEVITNKNSE